MWTTWLYGFCVGVAISVLKYGENLEFDLPDFFNQLNLVLLNYEYSNYRTGDYLKEFLQTEEFPICSVLKLGMVKTGTALLNRLLVPTGAKQNEKTGEISSISKLMLKYLGTYTLHCKILINDYNIQCLGWLSNFKDFGIYGHGQSSRIDNCEELLNFDLSWHRKGWESANYATISQFSPWNSKIY